MTTTKVEEIKIEDVLSVYSGKADSCCCGCAGKHYYKSNTDDRNAASKERGYPVQDDEVSDSMIKKVTRIVNEAIKAESIQVDSETCLCATVGNRWYIVYLKK